MLFFPESFRLLIPLPSTQYMGFSTEILLPLYSCNEEVIDNGCSAAGLELRFWPKIVPVDLDPTLVPCLLAKALKILSGSLPDEREVPCENCQRTKWFMDWLKGT